MFERLLDRMPDMAFAAGDELPVEARQLRLGDREDAGRLHAGANCPRIRLRPNSRPRHSGSGALIGVSSAPMTTHSGSVWSDAG